MVERIIAVAGKHLHELDAYDAPNPTLAKAITMRRLLDAGIDFADAKRAVETAFTQGATD